jgi:hypothetical protein
VGPLNPFDWAVPSGALQLYGVMSLTLVGCILKLFGAQWDDWLDERWGRGSVRDNWLLDRCDSAGRDGPLVTAGQREDRVDHLFE